MYERSLSNATKRQKYSNNSIKLNTEFDQIKQPVPGFEEATILTRYHQMQKAHFQQLATINVSDTLKRKLFGFSTHSYLTNDQDPNDLVFQNHPLKGRIIMTKSRFEAKYNIGQRSAYIQKESFSDSSINIRDSLKIDETTYNKIQTSSQLLLIDEVDENKDSKVEKTEGRLMEDVRV